MRALIALALTAVGLATADGVASGASSPTALRVTFRASDNDRPVVRTLRCDPAGGSVARPARACAALTAVQRPFAPVARNAVCTEIYGGPQTARVTGSYRGKSIWVVFRRINGCEIDRWDRHAFLFPGAT
jgi:hypothetical protein